jgi:hypothetical protein
MPDNCQLRDFRCCAVCGGRFGLVRYYSWQNASCSKRCAGRFRDRRESDRRWLMPASPLDLSPRASVDEVGTYQGISPLYL